MFNPLFSNDTDDKKNDDSYVLGKRHAGRIEPIHKNLRPDSEHHDPPVPSAHPAAKVTGPQQSTPLHPEPEPVKRFSNPAVEMIRRKLDTLYASEPTASQEIKEVEHEPAPQRSKHQQFMYDLSTSGKSLAEIQTAWHNYYIGLPDAEKHEVWQEFYAANTRRSSLFNQAIEQHTAEKNSENEDDKKVETSKTKPEEQSAAHAVTLEPTPPVVPHQPKRSASALKRRILNNVSAEAQEKAKRHLKSLVFGFGTGFIVLLIFLFSFFNEIIIAPFIQPSRTAAATPIILSTDGIAPTSQNEVIIPKLNLEAPIDFSLNTTDENTIENSLEDGVVHYPTTVLPGQKGNTAYFGHSSNNILNPGSYKFVFVRLHELVPGDIFYITYNGKVYTYQVYQKQIVSPSDVGVLNNVPNKTATATLITCDPPGTSINRLVVWGEQISPDPSGNTAAAAPSVTTQPSSLPSNGPTLWSRFIHWLF